MQPARLTRGRICVCAIAQLPFLTTLVASASPVARHGHLRVEGTRLLNQDGDVVQLKGVATHGLQWHGAFYEDGLAIKSAGNEWGAQVIRLTVYVYEGGYLDSEKLSVEEFDKMIFGVIDACVDNGLYCIVDWHVHHPGYPGYYLKDAKTFFDKLAARYSGVPNVLYEIANEPNRTGYKDIPGHEVSWEEIKAYAAEVIPVIRHHSPDAVVLVGTPAWSSLGHSAGRDWTEVADSPLDHENVLYVLHFYAAGHSFEAKVEAAAQRLPLFVTEWAAASWSTDSRNNPERAAEWLRVIDQNRIGWTYWNFAPGDSVFATFKKGTRPDAESLRPQGDSVTETGRFLYGLLQDSADAQVESRP